MVRTVAIALTLLALACGTSKAQTIDGWPAWISKIEGFVQAKNVGIKTMMKHHDIACALQTKEADQTACRMLCDTVIARLTTEQQQLKYMLFVASNLSGDERITLLTTANETYDAMNGATGKLAEQAAARFPLKQAQQ